MTVTYDQSYRNANMGTATLEEKFEVMKEIGDGSFGSVVLARTRTAGSHVAKRGTMIAIKTMKKTFESFSSCLELREVIFLRTLPHHPHLVPALDIFLDPMSKKLHICMEYMDGNLYQLMKAREQKCLDSKTVKSILFQILSGLDHIHAHNFFHRDIKPENILVSSTASGDSSAFSRFTPPATPSTFSVKIADFGLARETHSTVPYTTYVSTRWYRAPEVLLRAGEYSAPVDMWAVGAMAVEIATLKPLFPGRNEVDQMAPHSMESILQPPHWPVAFSNFVTWCLMWDPKSRPTSSQALNHDYFVDAIDPLRPKSSRLLGRKQSDKSFKSAGRDANDSPALSTKASWFRRSLIGRDSPAPVLEEDESRRLPAISHNASPDLQTTKPKPVATKRATWTNGAPMPILPSIRPVSPLSNAVTAQANSSVSHANDGATANHSENGQKSNKKIGRQLSVNSNGNHYSDVHRQEAERALNGGGGLATPASATKESFFSHLRKRARRLSGRSQGTSNNNNSNNCDDVEANAGCVPWSNRSSMALDSVNLADQKPGADFAELDKALQNVRYSLDITSPSLPTHLASPTTTNAPSNRQLIPQGPSVRNTENYASNPTSGPISSRTRRALQLSTHPVNRYETPEEEDELLHEVLHSTTKAARHLGQRSVTMDDMTRDEIFKKGNYQSIRAINPTSPILNPYPTPSPSSKCDGAFFGPETLTPSKPLRMNKPDNIADKHDSTRQWPTPPYDESQWAESAAESIFAAVGSTFR
ncbi:sporulation protein kinase mde3 [Histoplasma capsulatum var. duboisii H88]|uniref:Sporulation protein kinase mde3 n=1 Tax=Ajellomyces capsulatus (strain H88) TaxID=544711 RepID=F0UUJ8_AJEC8|nr:sporulation protein kinase mde3 [Histoplasma capsulatum var. duboisii H88]